NGNSKENKENDDKENNHNEGDNAEDNDDNEENGMIDGEDLNGGGDLNSETDMNEADEDFQVEGDADAEDEVLEYHNDYVDEIDHVVDEIEEIAIESYSVEDEEEADGVIQEMMTKIDAINDYCDRQDPEEEMTKEYHELRSAWAEGYYEG